MLINSSNPDSRNNENRNPIISILIEKLVDSLTKPLPDFTPRHIYTTDGVKGKATAVIGMRRSGKTVFLHQMRHNRMVNGLSREQLPYINFEDERLEGITSEYLNPVFEEYYRRFPSFRDKEKVMWGFDEIQLVPGWERFVRRILDSENVEVVVTGSSAALLSREIATAMRGRAWEVIIHPFSFEEYLMHKQYEIPNDPSFISASQRSNLERLFIDYLESGGFPEVQGLSANERHKLLKDYVDVAILRDVVERHGVTNIAGLRWMVRHLLGNPGSLFSIEKFYASLKSQGIAISKDTVHQYLTFLEDCFLVRLIWMESRSERQRMVNPRKAYPVDSGLIPVFDRSGEKNYGHSLETAVFIELERRNYSVSYLRTPKNYEVDFFIKKFDGTIELIQVCADMTNPSTMEREIRALIDAGDHYPSAKKILLTLYRETLPLQVPSEIIVRPAYEWMLERKL